VAVEITDQEIICSKIASWQWQFPINKMQNTPEAIYKIGHKN
jgi:hypothetical protein